MCITLQKILLLSCPPDSQDQRCTPRINFCIENPCKNNGICRSLKYNYTCQCLDDNYSGQHCEIISDRILCHRIYSKIISSFAMFIVVMDILKYFFGIDPVAEDREYLRRKRQANKHKHPRIQRFTYIHAPVNSHTDTTTTV